MKKTLTCFVVPVLLLICICALSLQTNAVTTFTEGYYTYTVFAGEATIINHSSSISGDVTIPSTLGGYPVTAFGSSAFYNCTGLTSVIIPDSIAIIGDGAFYGCTSLSTVTIPGSVTTIGDRAFSSCTSLSTVTIPDGVQSIGANAFFYCTSLTSATIGDDVTTIGECAFEFCDSLTTVTIGKSVDTIGKFAFHYCESLVAVYVKDIEVWCEINFVDSYSNPLFYAKNLYLNGVLLTELTVPNGVTAIGNYAFYFCWSLASVTIPDSVQSIGKEAFYDCINLESVTIGDGVIAISEGAFKFCSGLTSVTIPDSVTVISEESFRSCNNLTAVTIGDSVTVIGDYAFFQCELSSVTIPDSVQSIGKEAFSSCDYLTSITIGNGVTTIGDSAFSGCYSLKNVYYAADGTKWSEISIGSYNGYLTGATIHYGHIHDYSLVPPVTMAATCTKDGYTKYTCVYGETYLVILPRLPHSYTGTELVVAPTCMTEGYTSVSCARCSNVSKKDTVPALGHNMVIDAAKNPTCTETGLTTGSYCGRCQMVGIAQTVIPATGHSYTDGICTNCGVPEYTPGDLDGVEGVNEDDAIYLLRHVLMPGMFAVNQNVDFNRDGKVNEDDSIYLLRHVLMPNQFPL